MNAIVILLTNKGWNSWKDPICVIATMAKKKKLAALYSCTTGRSILAHNYNTSDENIKNVA